MALRPRSRLLEHGNDLNALMLLLLVTGNCIRLSKLAGEAEDKGQNNVAFACRLQLGETDKCVELLVKTGRAPEAALFARTYAPS